MLDDARQTLASNASHFQFAIADAQNLLFPDNSFDYIIANHMLYHIPDRAKAFIISSLPIEVITDQLIQQLYETVSAHITKHGYMHITKETGMFIAHS